MGALAQPKVVALVQEETQPQAGLCPWEDAEAFAALSRAQISAHSPKGPTEEALVDRLVWIEWRRRRLIAAESAVHVAHAFDRAGDSHAKAKTLSRAGATDHRVHDQISISEILRGSDEDDRETVDAIREGLADIEATLEQVDQGAAYDLALARLDEDMRSWWLEALEETDDQGVLKYEPSAEGLARFLRDDGLPWREGWLAINEVRPAIRAQAIAESLDPQRIGQLWDMEARLDRQFEKALSMLIRLQEMRAGRGQS